MNENLESVTLRELESGVAKMGGGYACTQCGQFFAKDEVYPVDGHYLKAKAAARRHAQTAHGSRLEVLLNGESRYVNITDHQKKLLRLLAAGKSDGEIAAETGATPATVRRQRFAFRERAKQAKMYLAIYGLATGGKGRAEALEPVLGGGGPMDDRFVLTEKEARRYEQLAFESLEPLRLKALPAKEKKKVAVLNRIAAQFEKGRDYTETQVNDILREIHPEEYVVLRRYLIEYGYLGRERDGSRYWMN